MWSSLALCIGTFVFCARRMLPYHVWELLLTPIAYGFFPWIAVRSAAITLWNGGVRWLESFYPLSELRANQRLKVTNLIRQK